MTPSKPFLPSSETQWEDLGNGVHRKILGHDKDIMMVKIKFDVGAVGAMHDHPHSQVTYVESGVFEMTIGSEKKTIYKGDGCYIAPNTRHGVVCQEAGILVDVFSPCREDFL